MKDWETPVGARTISCYLTFVIQKHSVFLGQSPSVKIKATAKRKLTNLKSFCIKETINKLKRQSAEWKKMSKNEI